MDAPLACEFTTHGDLAPVSALEILLLSDDFLSDVSLLGACFKGFCLAEAILPSKHPILMKRGLRRKGVRRHRLPCEVSVATFANRLVFKNKT